MQRTAQSPACLSACSLTSWCPC
ncbi:MAG: hypothetical protein II055_01010 [Prevotella sp.]|nr:hypothetical protein [Prevotella sp.]